MSYAEVDSICPHCGLWHDGKVLKMCPPGQRGRWTDTERNLWRERVRRRAPSIQFAPSSAVMATRFGHLARTKNDAARIAPSELS